MGETSDNSIRIKLPDHEEEFIFETPQKLIEWQQNLKNEWQWLRNSPAQLGWAQQENHLDTIKRAAHDWQNNVGHQRTRDDVASRVAHALRSLHDENNCLFRNEKYRGYIKETSQAHGPAAAAGVFAVLSKSDIRFEQNVPESFFEGLIRGFLFKNEIAWSATVHHAELEKLEKRYQQGLKDQEARLQHLESENKRLNDIYDSTLKEKAAALDRLSISRTVVFDELHKTKEAIFDNLHSAKEKAFSDLAGDFEKKYQAIKKLYTDELALRAPVQYWDESKQGHIKLAKRYAIASTAVFLLTATGLGFLIHWAFGSLKPGEDPKHWEVGVVVAATFFSVWIIRLLLRLFLSHQHLATDAEQKVTMVKTFLALGKEEGGVGSKDDRTIILQQLFRSPSDGIVKEDGTPPGLLEYFSRSK